MSKTDADKVWDLMESVGICMLATRDGEEIQARPMGAYVRREENVVRFLTDIRRHKDDEIARDPHVCLAFADSRGRTDVSYQRPLPLTLSVTLRWPAKPGHGQSAVADWPAR